jgi:hypothetical protein
MKKFWRKKQHLSLDNLPEATKDSFEYPIVGFIRQSTNENSAIILTGHLVSNRHRLRKNWEKQHKTREKRERDKKVITGCRWKDLGLDFGS